MTWRKSSYSANALDCVEVGQGVGIRDSKAEGVLALDASAWLSFLRAVKLGGLTSRHDNDS